MEIKGLGARPCGEGPEQYFVLLQASGPARVVTREQDARTAWHTHSPGLPLIATARCGRVQLWCRQARAFGLATACGRPQRTVPVEGQLTQRA
jgi:hypothetical protein